MNILICLKYLIFISDVSHKEIIKKDQSTILILNQYIHMKLSFNMAIINFYISYSHKKPKRINYFAYHMN